MKSKKIVALIVAFAAFMAVATSGLAAVTTTTNYYLTEGKVDVKVTATADPSSEVTYLVKSNDKIVYIDQKTADGSGNVAFNYKIAKDKIVGLATVVDFGTNGANSVDETGSAIELANVSVTAENATVVYYSNANCTEDSKITSAIVGNADTIYAKVTPNDGYTIVGATGTDATVDAYEMIIPVKMGANVVVTTEEEVKTPVIEEFDKVVGSDSFEGVNGETGLPEDEVETGTIGDDTETKYTAKTSIIKVAGTPSVVGVKYNNTEYPALGLDGNVPTSYSDAILYAVRIIVEGEQIGDIEIYSR